MFMNCYNFGYMPSCVCLQCDEDIAFLYRDKHLQYHTDWMTPCTLLITGDNRWFKLGYVSP